MKKTIKQSLMSLGLAAIALFSLLALPLQAVHAGGVDQGLSGALNDAGTGGLSDKELNPETLVTTGLKWLMYGIGIISVVMIIIGGIRYATSGGNAEKVKSAKNTILYAVVGLAVALLALAIVNFVNTDVVGNLGS